jgi:DNA-binding winged helix-turn-helix (wHTH) protein
MTETPASAPRIVRFGIFEVDLQSGELWRQGRKVKLQEKPFQVLALLLEHPGEVVSREQLRLRLWSADTFVEFDHSLSAAVNRLREALGDMAENPRFVETVPLRGYRFIAPVEEPGLAAPQQEAVPRVSRRRWVPVAAGAAVLSVGLLALWLRGPLPPPKVVRSVQITDSGRVMVRYPFTEALPALVTDGSRLYFTAWRGSGLTLAQVSSAGGEVLPVPAPSENVLILDISSDGSELLVRNLVGGEVEGPIWVVPLLGGAPRRLGAVVGSSATWSPDGEKIVYAHGQDLYMANSDGSEPHKLVTAPGRAVWLRWSPDGSHLRFTPTPAYLHSDDNFVAALVAGWKTDCLHGQVARQALEDLHRFC